MVDGWSFLRDLMLALSAATLLGAVFERLRQSAVVGYLLAGVLLGPGSLGLVRDAEAISKLSELGVALLLFTIGLEFSWRRVIRLGRAALLGGALSIVVLVLVGAGLGTAFGLSLRASLTLGAILSLGSTAVVLRVLKSNGALDSIQGKTSIGVLLMQDIAVVPLVMMVTALGGVRAGSGYGSVPGWQLLGNAFLLILGMVAVFTFIIPRALSGNTFNSNRELPILTAVVSCGAGTYAAHAAGLSAALGAFLAGMLLADYPFSEQMRADMNGLRTVFVTVFFASVGLLVDPLFLFQYAVPILGVTILVVALKAGLTFAVLKPFSPSLIGTLSAGISLAQIGEFSFVLAEIGRSSAILSPFLFQMVVSVSVLTLVLTPFLTERAPEISRSIAVRLFSKRRVAKGERDFTKGLGQLRGHVVLVGFGDAGRSALSALSNANLAIAVIDVDPRNAEDIRTMGYAPIIGDATHLETLEHAGIMHAKAAVITVADPRLTTAISRQLKLYFPHVPIIARARYRGFVDEIDVSGADVVVDEETLVGRRISQALSMVLDTPLPSPSPLAGEGQ